MKSVLDGKSDLLGLSNHVAIRVHLGDLVTIWSTGQTCNAFEKIPGHRIMADEPFLVFSKYRINVDANANGLIRGVVPVDIHQVRPRLMARVYFGVKVVLDLFIIFPVIGFHIGEG